MSETPGLSDWLLPAGLILSGALAGVLVERIVFRRLRELAKRTATRWDDILLRSLGHVPLILGTAAGIYAALLAADVGPAIRAAFEKTLAVTVIAAATLVAARMAGVMVDSLAERSAAGLPGSSLLSNIARLLVALLGLFVILQSLEIPITPLITGLGLGGLAVALALQPTLANLFSGFQIIAARQVAKGDYIRLDTGDEGYVVDIKWRNTTIKGLYDDHEIVVPNSKLADSIVTNYYLPRKRLWVSCDVGVSYASDLERVEEVSLDVAREVVRDVLGDAAKEEPVLRFHTFGDSSIVFTIRIPVDEFANQFLVRHEFVKRLHARYEREGIVIPFPIRTLELPESVRVTGASVPEGTPGA